MGPPRGRFGCRSATVVSAEAASISSSARAIAVPCDDGTVALDLRPFELVTLKLELAR